MTIAHHIPEDGDAALSEVVATRIRGLMAEKRLTQLEVSQALNVSRSGVSDRLNGVKPVNLNELPALAHLLDTSIDYLLGLTNDRSPRRAAAPGGGSMFVLPERTSGLLRACRDSNPKPSDPEPWFRRLVARLGRFLFRDRTPARTPDSQGGEDAGAVIIELPLPAGRIQAGEWPDDEPDPAPRLYGRPYLQVVS